MDEQAISSLAAIAVSLILQFIKDRLPLGKDKLKWVAAIAGAVAGGGAGYLSNADNLNEIIKNSGLAAVITTGIHSLLLQKSWLGKVLKDIGGLIRSPSPGLAHKQRRRRLQAAARRRTP